MMRYLLLGLLVQIVANGVLVALLWRARPRDEQEVVPEAIPPFDTGLPPHYHDQLTP
jgi:hypothetical protein